jgi:hypothetical protein
VLKKFGGIRVYWPSSGRESEKTQLEISNAKIEFPVPPRKRSRVLPEKIHRETNMPTCKL